MDFAQLFSGVSATINSAIVAVVPIAVGIFATIFAVKKGAQLLRSIGK